MRGILIHFSEQGSMIKQQRQAVVTREKNSFL